MWTHYEDQLSGICFVFNEALLKNSLERNDCLLHQKLPTAIQNEQFVGEYMGLESVAGLFLKLVWYGIAKTTQ